MGGLNRIWNTITFFVISLTNWKQKVIYNFFYYKICIYVGNVNLGNIQVGSLAGAAHLLKDNAGVQRLAQLSQKLSVEEQAKSQFDLFFQYKY